MERLGGALCALAWIAGASLARAQSPADPVPAGPAPAEPPRADDGGGLPEAKRLFREAEARREAGDCAGALALYAQSRALVSSVPNTLNGAACATAIGRPDEAMDLYAQLLAEHRGELSEDELVRVQAEMRRLRAILGHLDVTGQPGATLVVGGRRRGQLPLIAPIPVAPGELDVRVVKQGFEPFVTTVEVVSGQTATVRAELEPLREAGSVVVQGPAGAELWVDGSPVGTLPFEGTFAPGEHVYQVIDGDQGTAPTPMMVVVGQTASLSPSLSPLGGQVVIAAVPPEGRLAIGGVDVGTGRWLGRLPVGTVTVEARAESYLTASRVLRVDTGEVPSVELTLEPDPTHPRWAEEDAGHFWFEAMGGIAVGPGFGGGVAATCGTTAACGDGGLTRGFTAGLRLGYELPFALSVELSGTYLGLGEDVTRTFAEGYLDRSGANVPVTYELEDRLRARGGLVLAGLGYRFGLTSLLELRGHLGAGLSLLQGRDVVAGTARSGGAERAVGVVRSGETSLGIGLVVSPEIDLGVHLDGWTLGLGVATQILPLAGPSSNLGEVSVLGTCDNTAPTAPDCAPSEALLGEEALWGTLILVNPSLRAGYRF